MDLILDDPPRSFWLQIIEGVSDFDPPFGSTPYVCLLWDTVGDRSNDELMDLSNALVATGARYVVAGGTDCERWHDAVDDAFLALELDGAEYDARFVMTSWHTDQTPDEVAFFFVGCTNFDEHRFTEYLVLQLGSDWHTQQGLCEAVRNHALAPEDDEPEETWS
jgi:hypothetical protein